MQVTIKTRTPLWTGGVERKVDRIHETGLIGSLRWWYEAILRGLDGWACDPTEHKCDEEKRCAACELFGTTGWSRQFRIKVSGKQEASPDLGEIIVDPRWQERGWRLGSGILSDRLIITMLPMRLNNMRDLSALTFLIKSIACWGALGARTQIGYGVFEMKEIIMNGKVLSVHEIVDTLSIIEHAAQEHPAPPPSDKGIPDIRDFFFARLCLPSGIQVKQPNWLGKPQYLAAKGKGFIPIAPAVRYDMRGWFRKESDSFFEKTLCKTEHSKLKELRHNLMGTIRGRPLGSKLFTSHLYQTSDGWEFRIWGWVPGLTAYQVQREDVMQSIRQRLLSQEFAHKIVGLSQPLQVEWHCFDPDDSKSVSDYLKELAICGKEMTK